MEVYVEESDAEELKTFFEAERSAGKDEEYLLNRTDRLLREQAFKIARLPDNLMENAVRNFFNFVLDLCLNGFCNKCIIVIILQDMCEVNRIGRCERLFDVLEENMEIFKMAPLGDACQSSILRMCNDLLRRMSRTVETSFCGRVLFFLSRFMPLNEKSGLNFVGVFNTANTTIYDKTNVQCIDNVEDDAETGEIIETKGIVPVDQLLYSMFWQLQAFYSNPALFYEKAQWSVFQRNISEVLQILSIHKLDKTSVVSHDEKEINSVQEVLENSASYFAKYLTNPKLLQLQLNDSQFRRFFLVQSLVIFQYLLSEARCKLPSQILSEEGNSQVNDWKDRCHRLLKETSPHGSRFNDNIKKILHREKNWCVWKNRSCPDMTRNVDPTPMLTYRKRPHQHFNSQIMDLGSTELTKLWCQQSQDLDVCGDIKRKFIPNLSEFLRDPFDELDPEQQVNDEYKSVNNAAFQWRASRFLLVQSSRYLSSNMNQNGIGGFLTDVIINAALEMEEFKGEVSKRDAQNVNSFI